MENTVKERLKLFLRETDVKATDFCKSIDVSSGFISGMRESIQPDKLKNIALKYPNLDIGWLMTGKGDMIKSYRISSSSGKNGVTTSYIGTFTKPIVTDIKNIQGNSLLGSGSFTGGDNIMADPNSSTQQKDGKSKNVDIGGIEQRIEIEKLKAEIERLNARIELKDAIIENKNFIIEEKERMISILLKRNN